MLRLRERYKIHDTQLLNAKNMIRTLENMSAQMSELYYKINVIANLISSMKNSSIIEKILEREKPPITEDLLNFMRVLKQKYDTDIKEDMIKKKSLGTNISFNEKERQRIYLKIINLRKNDSDSPINNEFSMVKCNVLLNEMKEKNLTENRFIEINNEINLYERESKRYPLEINKLRAIMYRNFRKSFKKKDVCKFFTVSNRTLEHYENFLRLVEEYPRIIKVSLSFSIIIKHRHYINILISKNGNLFNYYKTPLAEMCAEISETAMEVDTYDRNPNLLDDSDETDELGY